MRCIQKPIALFNVHHITSKVLRVTIQKAKRSKRTQCAHCTPLCRFSFFTDTIDFLFFFRFLLSQNFHLLRRHRSHYFSFLRFLLQQSLPALPRHLIHIDDIYFQLAHRLWNLLWMLYLCRLMKNVITIMIR